MKENDGELEQRKICKRTLTKLEMIINIKGLKMF